jgi:hypothetical protein
MEVEQFAPALVAALFDGRLDALYLGFERLAPVVEGRDRGFGPREFVLGTVEALSHLSSPALLAL